MYVYNVILPLDIVHRLPVQQIIFLVNRINFNRQYNTLYQIQFHVNLLIYISYILYFCVAYV